MKNFVFLFITIFIIELFPKTANATMDISIDLGPTFKQSLKGKIDDDTYGTVDTSLQVLANLPAFFHEVINLKGIGSTSIGLRNSGVITGAGPSRNGYLIQMLSLLLKQRFITITEDYRGFFPEVVVGMAIFSGNQLSLSSTAAASVTRGLGGFVAGAGLGYKLMDHFFIRAEAGWFYSTLESKNGVTLSTPYMTLGIGWFLGMPSSSSNPVEQTLPNSVEGPSL